MDSAADITGAIRDVVVARGAPGPTFEFLRGYIGRHLFDTFSDLGFPEEQHEAMLNEYRAIYPARKHASTSVFPGVAEMLAGLGGWKSTATTKGTPMTRSVLEQFGLLHHFSHVQDTDGFPAKPQPDVILKSLQLCGVEPSQCLLVGDAPADMEAGRRAGVKTCAVRWGYGDPSEMARWNPDYWIDQPAELLNNA